SDFGKPTLSVGIAIGHFMENLEDLLNWGRAAEKAAKEPDRDGLAIHLHKRGGAPIRVRSRWTDDGPPDQRINDYANLIQNESLPGGLPYELQKLADLYDGWPQETKTAALRADVSRVIGKKNQGAGVPASIERTVGTIVDA